MRYLYTLFIFSLTFLLAFPPLKDSEIDSFIIARYSGDTSMVNQTIASGFLYVHTPYVGLGVSAYYVDGSLLITYVVNDSIQTFLSVGDKIHEHNEQIKKLDQEIEVKKKISTVKLKKNWLLSKKKLKI